MVVENFTDNEMADTLTMVILNKLMDYDTMKINIYPLPLIFERDDKMEYFAFIVHVPFEPHRYNIFLQKNASIGKMKTVFTHELVHLQQYESGDLRTIDNYGYVWKGDTVQFKDVEYDYRPYEKEASTLGHFYEKKLNDILYKPRQ